MLNLSYANFANAYRHYASLDRSSLSAELGWEERGAQFTNGALLASLALLTLGSPVPGTQRIEAGHLIGRRVCNGANRLADWLSERHVTPEIIPLEQGLSDVAYQLFGRRGIVAFIQGTGPAGGLIGLLDGRNAPFLCRAAESHYPLEIRFWELS